MVISAFIFMGSLKHTISMVVSVWTLWPMAVISISMTIVASMLSDLRGSIFLVGSPAAAGSHGQGQSGTQRKGCNPLSALHRIYLLVIMSNIFIRAQMGCIQVYHSFFPLSPLFSESFLKILRGFFHRPVYNETER